MLEMNEVFLLEFYKTSPQSMYIYIYLQTLVAEDTK